MSTPAPPPARLDVRLVSDGLARSRGQARQLVIDGQVRVDDEVVTKPASPVPASAQVAVTAPPGHHWVGRGAAKLDDALTLWSGDEATGGLSVRGRRCLDAGASTGGFTQVLLERGAASVLALDVGHGQLAGPVVADPRVTDASGTDLRDLDVGAAGGPFDLVVADLSFISLTLVMPVLAAATAPEGGDLVVLVKPQFEVGRERLGKGGVVRSAQARRDALRSVLAAATEAGLGARALIASPIQGTHGNHEYLMWLATPRPGMMSAAAAASAIDRLAHAADGAPSPGRSRSSRPDSRQEGTR